MYGTVARIKIKPGTLDQFSTVNEEMSSDAGHGEVAVMVFQSNDDPDELYLVAVFEDEEKYYANADRPEMDANFRKMSQYFAEDPQWHDGEVVYFKQF
jgi:quinol monooxygenase YgiN